LRSEHQSLTRKDKGAQRPSTGLAVYLKKMSREDWEKLGQAVEHRVVPPDTVIFKRGDPGDEFYLIRSGKVRLYREDVDGIETSLSILGALDTFGEMSLLTGETRFASAKTLEETHLMVLSKEQFEHILKNSPEITYAFVQQMSQLLLRVDKTVEREEHRRRRESRPSWFDFLIMIGLSAILAFVFNHSNPSGITVFPKPLNQKDVARISPVKAMAEVEKGDAVIVDAGPEGFYQRKHIEGAVSVPLALSDILYEVTFEGDEKGKKVIVYGGTFSKLYDWELAGKLVSRGLKGVSVLEGGIQAWERAGYPVQVWEEKK
jgi:CRP-like cAMP-binding protein